MPVLNVRRAFTRYISMRQLRTMTCYWISAVCKSTFDIVLTTGKNRPELYVNKVMRTFTSVRRALATEKSTNDGVTCL